VSAGQKRGAGKYTGAQTDAGAMHERDRGREEERGLEPFSEMTWRRACVFESRQKSAEQAHRRVRLRMLGYNGDSSVLLI